MPLRLRRCCLYGRDLQKFRVRGGFFRMINLPFATVAFFPLLATPASAQLATTTSLVGTVTDSSGKAVQNARVTAIETGTLGTQTRTTNDQGYYSFEFARVGMYSITVEQPGFQKVTKTGIQVDI